MSRLLPLLLLIACDASDQATTTTQVQASLRLDAGQWWAVVVDPELGLVADPLPAPVAPSEAQGAVDAAPAWVAEDLSRALAAVAPDTAVALAEVVDQADALWLDEVTWSMAHTHPAVLDWIVGHEMEWIFLDNAAAIYEVDPLLAHADLVELEDGLTTLDLFTDEGVVQLEPEVYYHHVVYPRGYLDLPAANGESFWRTYWLEDDQYGATLVQSVEGSATVLEAAEATGEWIQSFMEFGYGTNPIYPLEIYWEQYGSCGQYAILTSAAARTVLIPTVAASARADDHEWNELWDGSRWIMWDNSLGEIGSNPNYPYIDWPDVFDQDQGGTVLHEVAHVFRMRTDEVIEPSDLYTSYSQLHYTVIDGDGLPVEGARVLARSEESGSFLAATWAPTGPDGVAELWLGDDHFWTFEIDHPELGHLPKAPLERELRTDEDDELLTQEASFSGVLDRHLTDGGEASGTRQLVLSLSVDRTVVHSPSYLTEGYELGHTAPWDFQGGRVDVFLVDQGQLERLEAGEEPEVRSARLGVESLDETLELPADAAWALVVHAGPASCCDRVLSLDLELLQAEPEG